MIMFFYCLFLHKQEHILSSYLLWPYASQSIFTSSKEFLSRYGPVYVHALQECLIVHTLEECLIVHALEECLIVHTLEECLIVHTLEECLIVHALEECLIVHAL